MFYGNEVTCSLRIDRCLPLYTFLGIHGFLWLIGEFLLASLKGQGLLLRIVIELDMRMKNYIIVLGRRHIDVTPKR